jgi:hypothetical protein
MPFALLETCEIVNILLFNGYIWTHKVTNLSYWYINLLRYCLMSAFNSGIVMPADNPSVLGFQSYQSNVKR